MALPSRACPENTAVCKNGNTWPVLVGEASKNERDTMLSSLIILCDYPQIAPESAGDLFDGAEIDELLRLRIMTMTDEEKREMRDMGLLRQSGHRFFYSADEVEPLRELAKPE